MGLEKRPVDNLVSEKQLWVIAIVLEPGAPRFGPGLFNKYNTYGDQTTAVHKIRDKLYQEQYLHFVVRANDLESVVKDFREACKGLPKVPLAEFFPQHPQHPFLQEGDYASTENRPYVKPEVNFGFRDWYHYNTFVGYGTIIEQESELKRANNGELFAAQIQVFAISKEDSNTYMACLRLPDEIQRRSVGSSAHIHWHRHGGEVTDPWRGDIIEPLPAARTDTTSLIIYRPSKETHGARQPKIASNLKDAPFENVMVKIIVSDKTFKRFLGCNLDLQHWSKAEVCRELLGGDLMALPEIGLLSDVNRELIDTTFAHGRVNLDISKVIDGLPHARGRFFVVTGPAGSGKTYVMHLLSLLILKGSKMFYPVHPDGATGKWMPNFHKYNRGTSEMEEEPEKKEHKPQVVISCPTNNLTSDNCVKLQFAADNLFAGEPIMIIRIHPLELEFLIAKQSFTHHEQHSQTAEMEHDQQQPVEEISVEGLIKVLSEVLEHYQKSFSSAGFAATGIKDSRLQLMEHSLGYRMLQVCGIIPGSLWTVSGAYENFVAFHQDRLRHASEPNEAQELAFRKYMIRLARETLARADILIGTPFVLGTYLIYSSLHPTAVCVDEAGTSKESDILPVMTYYFPKAFGVFGDPKQLGPTIMSTMEENSFHGQIELSLLSRLILNGCTRFDLIHQHRLTKDIYNFTNQLFCRGQMRWQRTQVIDPNAWSSKVMDYNFHRYKVKKNMVFLNIPKGQEFSVGHSWANRAHVVIGLNLPYDFIMSCSIPPADIVILVGYDAQKREYLSEMSRRVESNPGIKWLDIRVTVIDSFQGNQAPFVILDLVRSETLGHLRSFRRLKVGMTRGSFGFWCLYNVNSMMEPIDRDAWVIREMRSLIKGSRLGATMALPEI
ncbi:hypothetical protein N7541_001215 [Penicillium brevicompactum]|uniref:DNA2/NAM7 helicase-like C-terminal domain-containing protein n=1 Tax=Penicillium brevicompactum TaxID=5074 RepID=A0A9W9RXQ5_PENBR|nr:hypothetical protein N7541_001215 [Penicillium brevicompactum]